MVKEMKDNLQKNLPDGYFVYENSIQENNGTHFAIVRNKDGEKSLCVLGEAPGGLVGGKNVVDCVLLR